MRRPDASGLVNRWRLFWLGARVGWFLSGAVGRNPAVHRSECTEVDAIVITRPPARTADGWAVCSAAWTPRTEAIPLAIGRTDGVLSELRSLGRTGGDRSVIVRGFSG